MPERGRASLRPTNWSMGWSNYQGCCEAGAARRDAEKLRVAGREDGRGKYNAARRAKIAC